MEPRESEVEQPTEKEKEKELGTASLEEKVETPAQSLDNRYILESHNFWMDLHN